MIAELSAKNAELIAKNAALERRNVQLNSRTRSDRARCRPSRTVSRTNLNMMSYNVGCACPRVPAAVLASSVGISAARSRPGPPTNDEDVATMVSGTCASITLLNARRA